MKEIIITKITGKNGRPSTYEIDAFDMSKKYTLIDTCKTERHDDVQGIVFYMQQSHDIDNSKITYEAY